MSLIQSISEILRCNDTDGPTILRPHSEATASPFSMRNTQVAIGPVIAETIVGGAIPGCFSLYYPSVALTCKPRDNAPHLFSLKLITAKPTICARSQSGCAACKANKAESCAYSRG